MSKPIVDLGPEVKFLNDKSRAYHLALQSAQEDLYGVFCLDLWPDMVVMTKVALKAFGARYGGKVVFSVVLIDAVSAALFVDTVLVTEDIMRLEIK
jgi:hypothetical protein